MTIKRILFVLALLSLASSLQSAPPTHDFSSHLESFVRDVMAENQAQPGMTVVVVKDGHVVYQSDFGLRDVEASLPVNRDTKFYVASTTKAFTGMLAAILAGEHKLDLDQPLSTSWPELKLTAPLDPTHLTLRDLLAMRSGLGNDTLNFRMEIGNVSEADLLPLLASYSREEPRTFRYSNLNYILAAHVIERATGKSWRDLVTSRILKPLQMTSASLEPHPGTNVAKAYRVGVAPGTFVEVPVELSALAAPAGGMQLTSSDAARWLIALTGNGRVGRRQKLPREAVRLVQEEQTKNEKKFRSIDRFAWGLGEDLGKYDGDLIVHRFGGLNGAYSHVSFMPAHNIGVAVFANSGSGAVPDAIASYAYDLLLDKKDLDAKWSAARKELKDATATARAQRRKSDEEVAAKRADAPHPLASYAGVYHYDRLGDMTLTADAGRLYGTYGIFRSELIPVGKDAFVVDFTDRGDLASMQFVFEGDQPVRLVWGQRIFTPRALGRGLTLFHHHEALQQYADQHQRNRQP
jgi:CubicO group peptidase (beta-lactamase class C family)